MQRQSNPALIKVWDPFVRVSHWVVAVGFFIAYIVEDEPLVVHVWAGYFVGGLVLLRMLWGVVGPKHARFTNFVYAPSTIVRYLTNVILFRAERYLGHSPAGGAMVVALFVTLLATSISGVLLYGAEEHAGPAASLYATSSRTDPATSDTPPEGSSKHNEESEREYGAENERDTERGEEHAGGESAFLEELHEVSANLSLALVIAHVVGVALASAVHRENLPRAMITGRKRAS